MCAARSLERPFLKRQTNASITCRPMINPLESGLQYACGTRLLSFFASNMLLRAREFDHPRVEPLPDHRAHASTARRLICRPQPESNEMK